MSEQSGINAAYFAQLLSGREYRKEMVREEEELAKEHGVVIIFGASDDLAEIRGAIRDEVGCYDGGTIYFDGPRLFSYACDGLDDCPHELKRRMACKTVQALWDQNGVSWSYQTEIPHHSFIIYDDEDGNEAYCNGICFDMAELECVVPTAQEGGAA